MRQECCSSCADIYNNYSHYIITTDVFNNNKTRNQFHINTQSKASITNRVTSISSSEQRLPSPVLASSSSLNAAADGGCVVKFSTTATQSSIGRGIDHSAISSLACSNLAIADCTWPLRSLNFIILAHYYQ